MATLTTEEALKQDQDVLGRDYGIAYYHACQELWRVSSNWDRYEALYSTTERVELLNKSSGHFWGTMQNVLFENVLLGICRLTDRAISSGRRNLSIYTLYELEPLKNKTRLKQVADRANKKAKFARTWRDKRISHNDFVQITETSNLLSRATRKKVTTAIVYIHFVLRWIHRRHFNGDRFLLNLGDSDALRMMSVLADGQKYRELRKKAWSEENYLPEFEYTYEWKGKSEYPDQRYEIRMPYKLPKYRG